MWPFTRRVVYVEWPEAYNKAVADGYEKLAAAIRYSADARSGLLPSQQPPADEPAAPLKSEREKAIDEWLASVVFEETKHDHATAMAAIFLGKRKPEGDWTWGAAAQWLKSAGAPVGV